MRETESDADLRALGNIRRHLTVAFLAVEHLCRKVGSLPPLQRLCSFATDALTAIKDEVVGLEALILRRERRDRSLADELPNHSLDP